MHNSDENLTGLYKSLGNLQYDFRNKNLSLLICSFLKGSTVLDIGSGGGHLLAHARNKGFHITGIEPNQQLLELSKQHYGFNSEIQNLPAEKVTEIKNKFDNITIIDVLEHIEDDVMLISNLKSLLSGNGRVVILVPHHPALYGKRDKNIGHYRRYSQKELFNKLKICGFKIIQWRTWNMIGVLPYWWAEKINKKEINSDVRTKQGGLNSFFDIWFKFVENNLSLGWGLSLICVAEPL